MIFNCNTHGICSSGPWEARLRLISRNQNSLEASVQARGSSFHFIVGTYLNGGFLCMPGYGFGCNLSDLDDTEWNRHQLRQKLNIVDAETMVSALQALSTLDKNI